MTTRSGITIEGRPGHRRPRWLTPGAIGLCVAASATACAAPTGCGWEAGANYVDITLVGDSSTIDRLFVCAPEVTDCVVPRQATDPVASRVPGRWVAAVQPHGSTPEVAEIYAVDFNNNVLAKQRVTVKWVDSEAGRRCGTASAKSAELTVQLTSTGKD